MQILIICLAGDALFSKIYLLSTGARLSDSFNGGIALSSQSWEDLYNIPLSCDQSV